VPGALVGKVRICLLYWEVNRIDFPSVKEWGMSKSKKERRSVRCMCSRRDQITLDTAVVLVLTDFGEGWSHGRGGITCMLGARRTVDLELLPGLMTKAFQYCILDARCGMAGYSDV